MSLCQCTAMLDHVGRDYEYSRLAVLLRRSDQKPHRLITLSGIGDASSCDLAIVSFAWWYISPALSNCNFWYPFQKTRNRLNAVDTFLAVTRHRLV